jgi:hypothetical protein
MGKRLKGCAARPFFVLPPTPMEKSLYWRKEDFVGKQIDDEDHEHDRNDSSPGDISRRTRASTPKHAMRHTRGLQAG